MPATEEGMTLALAYREGQVLIADMTAKRLGMIWTATVDPDHIGATVPEFADAGASTIMGGQDLAVKASDAFVSAYLWAETDEAHLPVGIDAGKFFGLTGTDTATLPGVLLSSGNLVRKALEQGRPVEEAMDHGLYRATRLAKNEVLEAGQRSLSTLAQRTKRFSGWRRATSSSPCKICVSMADGFVHRWGDKVRVHVGCSCSAVPVVRDLRERYLPATTADLEVT